MFKLVVLFAVVALAAAKPGYLAYSAPGHSSVSQYSTSVVHGAPYAYAPAVYSAPVVAPAVVAAPIFSQAPHSPAVVLDAVHGVPLDTPEVVAARAAHYQAKALSHVHHLGKRSLAPVTYSSVVAPVAAYSAYGAPVVSTYGAPVTYSAGVVSPFAYSAVVPKAYGVHPW